MPESNNTLGNNASNVYEKPLFMFEPSNIIALLILYSPFIIAICVFSMSFVFQNSKGFIYLGFLIASCITREFLMAISGVKPKQSSVKMCNDIQYSRYGNPGFSIFVISFTLFYICMPMFLNKDINYWIFGGLLAFLFMDIGIRYLKSCITDVTDIILNLVTGTAAGLLIPGLMFVGGSSKFLFFNEISSSKEVCSMPKKQQFKCSVYKNGELLTTN
uniref:Uncharacterized protein n=1 Tax=viral metagenome TaxID=1070528 RepID=A0A6C0B0H0_9ZZZZ